jgi:hypothetical protein
LPSARGHFVIAQQASMLRHLKRTSPFAPSQKSWQPLECGDLSPLSFSLRVDSSLTHHWQLFHELAKAKAAANRRTPKGLHARQFPPRLDGWRKPVY